VAEFVVKSTLIADPSRFKPGVDDAKRSLKDLGDEAKRATPNFRNLGMQMDDHIVLFRRYQAEAKAAAKALIEKQRSVRMLGIQLGDLGQQLAMGINPAVAFGQQIGQIGLAAEGMGGRIAKVAAFLSSPWGAALQTAAIVVGVFASKLLDTEDASKKAAKATKTLEEAIHDLNVATGKQVENQDLANKRTREEVENSLKRELRTRAETVALIEKLTVRQKLETLEGRVDRPAPTATALAANTGVRLSSAQDLLKKQTTAIEEARSALRNLDIDASKTKIDEKYDKMAAAAGRYNREEARLTDERQHKRISQADFEAGLDRARVARDRETAAIQKQTKAQADLNQQIGRNLSLAGAKQLVEGIGGTVTSGLRSTAKQAQLYAAYQAGTGPLAAKPGTSYHEKGQALDIAKTAGMSLGKIRQAFKDAGVSIRELLDEGDHFHVAWGKVTGSLNDGEKAAREAKKELDDLQQILDGLTKRFDPAQAAADDFAKTLADISRLEAAGMRGDPGGISLGQGAVLRLGASKEQADAQFKKFDAIGDKLLESMGVKAGESIAKSATEFGEEAAKSFGETASELAFEIGNIIGGRVGDALAGIGNLIEMNRKGSAFDKAFENIDHSISNLAQKGFKLKPEAADQLGKTVGGAVKGAATGATIAGIGKALGLKMSSTGAQIGGAIGSALPIPGGDIIGSILGGLVGGLFKKTKTGSATITNVDDKASLSGNSGKLKDVAGTLASSVQGGIQQIADALGGTLGSFAVSIGQRDKKYVVDLEGKGRTKSGDASTPSFKDESEAIARAIQDAIADGAVKGLSEAVQKALKSSDDIDKALNEALKVSQVELLLKGVTGEMEKAFSDFERTAAERVRIAKKYGFDLVKLEQINGEQRVKLFDQIVGARIGSLQNLLDSINYGDLFEGSAVAKLNKLRTEAQTASEDVAKGVDGAADRLADLQRQIVETSRDTFGTAGPEFATDRANAISAAEQAIALERQRAEQAEAMAQQTNTLLDENNDIAAQTLAATNQGNEYLAALLAAANLRAPTTFDTSRLTALV